MACECMLEIDPFTQLTVETNIDVIIFFDLTGYSLKLLSMLYEGRSNINKNS